MLIIYSDDDTLTGCPSIWSNRKGRGTQTDEDIDREVKTVHQRDIFADDQGPRRPNWDALRQTSKLLKLWKKGAVRLSDPWDDDNSGRDSPMRGISPARSPPVLSPMPVMMHDDDDAMPAWNSTNKATDNIVTSFGGILAGIPMAMVLPQSTAYDPTPDFWDGLDKDFLAEFDDGEASVYRAQL